MNKEELITAIRTKKSFLCVGLDTDPEKIPVALRGTDDPVYEFNKAIIDATHDLCVAYKPNLAFYESMGAKGWECLEKTMRYIPKGIFTIADAKRGDIGNTSTMYARAFFDRLGFDAVTVAPYMGRDSVMPFLEFEGKWVILLALTSNSGAADFQMEEMKDQRLFEKVLEVSKTWGSEENMMYVAGATRGELLAEVRKRIPGHFLLVPGIGAQGGSLEEVCRYAMTPECGLLVNASRNIIYASSDSDFATAARREALALQQQMEQILAG